MVDIKKKSFKYCGVSYQSYGEMKIARFLTEKKIKFVYEKELVLKRIYDKTKKSIVYPDFYIPYKKIIIEYFGVEGDSDYDKTVEKKRLIFKKNKYVLIEIFPKTPNKIWQNEILDRIAIPTFLNKLIQYRLILALKIILYIAFLVSFGNFIFF